MKAPEDPLVERLRRHRWISCRNLWLALLAGVVVLVIVVPFPVWFCVMAFALQGVACLVPPFRDPAPERDRRPLGWSTISEWRAARPSRRLPPRHPAAGRRPVPETRNLFLRALTLLPPLLLP
jgi:hypothetical protein